MIRKFERIITTTQSKYKAILEKKTINQQCSYNLPNDIEEYLLSINAIVRETPIGNNQNVTYILSDDYTVRLGSNILAIIGDDYSSRINKAVFTHTEGANGSSQKLQLKKVDFDSKGHDYKWFVDLYNRNIEGVNFVTYVDEDMRQITFDVELSSLIFERINLVYNVDENESNKRMIGGENIILYGVPGAGKSWTIKNFYCDNDDQMERLVFHPDYTYSDFVGQILPIITDENVSYEFTPGPFTKLLKKAYITPDKMFYLVIEEVNRGNAPAIFGDIFQLLDRTKDGSSEYEITNADIAKVVYGNENHKVSIPSNMSILCTMNTSDQNVFTLDTAFQRRWSMRLIKNKFIGDDEIQFAETKILDSDVTWRKFFTEINNIILSKNIRMTSSEDKRLGTHFVAKDDLNYIDGNEKQNSKFPEKVLKYLWDDAFKFTKEDIFDLDKVKSLEDVIELFVGSQGNTRFKVFKDNIFNTLVTKRDSSEN